MSKGQTLRVLVNARLTAAAEEIFALFEGTIAEFEEELRRSKEENQRKQERLESVLNPRVELLRADLRTTESPGPGLDQDLNPGLDPGLKQDTIWIKVEPEEQCIKQEQNQWSVPESSSACLKTEESSLILITEYKDEPQGEDIGAESHLHRENARESSDAHDDEDWRAPLSCSGAQMETEADGSASSPNKHIANNKAKTGAAKTEGNNQHQCTLCNKTFRNATNLNAHIKLHNGERPFICPVCGKGFVDATKLKLHNYTHTGERPFGCLICGKRFIVASRLKLHMKLHTVTGDRPFSCSVCGKGYFLLSKYKLHMRTHTGDRPYSCSVCGKTFTQSFYLKKHMKTHRNLTAETQML